MYSDIKSAKPHFEILDGLRGVAALVVVIFHFTEMVYADYSKNIVGHGFLAVDFFFCLSGFVIAYAYDDRMGKIGIKAFFKARLIRLHPLVLLGSVLGLIVFFIDPWGYADKYSLDKIGVIFITSILLIPYPVMGERAFNLFGLNAPAWSLFWEYIANIVYALVLWRMPRAYLAILGGIAAVVLFYVGYTANNVMGGWSGGTFWEGGARIAYSFVMGMVIYRFNLIIKNRLGFIGLSVLLLAALTMPYFKGNWMAEVMVVLVYFPLLVALGAGAHLQKSLRAICVFSGKISYPLYMTHYAVIWMFLNYYTAEKPDQTTVNYVMVGGVIGLVIVAYIVMVVYDTPVRRYLTQKWKRKEG